jgi:hypothetical protein
MLRPTLLLLAALAWLAAGDAPPDAAALQRRVAELEAEVAALRKQAVTFKTIADADIDIWLRGGPQDDATGIPAQVATLLGLTTEERATLKAAADQARAEIAALIAAQKPVAEAQPGSIRLVIQDFSDEGKLIDGQLQLSMRTALGPDRQRVLKRLNRHASESQFLNFGEGTQTFTFTKQEGRWSYRHETKGDNRSGSSSGNLVSLTRYALLRPYLPKELIEGVEGAPAAGAAPAQPKGADNF